MATFSLEITASLTARNLDSAQKKLEALKAALLRAGVDYTELELRGKA